MQTETPWPDPTVGPWLLRASFAVDDDGRLVPVGLEVWGVDPPQPRSRWATWARRRLPGPSAPLTAVAVRVPLTRLADEVRAAAGRLEGSAEGLEAVVKALGRPGRPRLYDDAHYKAVADVYRAAASAPTATVARTFGVTRSAAAKWVRKARRAGLLAS